MKKEIIIILGVLVLIIIGVGFLFLSKNKPTEIACTMEARLCPDGSYVGRTGPKCEFTACPNTETNTTSTKIGQKILSNGVYITPIKIVEDSRCPTDVVCVWAGRIILEVRLESGNETKTLNMEGGEKIIFGGKTISYSVTPENPTNPSTENTFTFIVQ